MVSLFRAVFCILTIAVFASCELSKHKEVAFQSVEAFRRQISEGKLSDIYFAAAPAMKTAVTEADFVKLLGAVRGRLGAFKSADLTGWRADSGAGRSFVVLTYKSDFERGSAAEEFTFILSGNGAQLQDYKIDSPALITN